MRHKNRVRVLNLTDSHDVSLYESLRDNHDEEVIRIIREEFSYIKGQGGMTEARITVWWQDYEN